MQASRSTSALLLLVLMTACAPSGNPPTDSGAAPANGRAAGRNEFPSSASTSSAAAGEPARPQSRAYVDPVTGELRAPSAAELAAASAQSSSTRSAAALRATPEVTVTQLPGGMTEYDVGDAGRVREQVCTQPDGSLARCAQAPAAAGNQAAGPRRP